MLKTIAKLLLCSKKPVYCNNVNIERRIHNVDRITTTGMNATQIAATKKKMSRT